MFIKKNNITKKINYFFYIAWLIFFFQTSVIYSDCLGGRSQKIVTRKVYVLVPGERLEVEPANVRNYSLITTALQGEKIHPQVSYDGRYVAFAFRPKSTETDNPFTNNIFVIDAITGLNPRPITQTEGKQEVYYPSMWRGTERVLFTRKDEPPIDYDICYNYFPPKNIESYLLLGRKELYWKGEAVIQRASPSPDGSKIAVCLETSASRKIRWDYYRRLIPLENPIIVIYDVEKKGPSFFTNGRDPAWSPDGKSIAFSRKVGDNYFIYVKDVETGEERQITQGSDAFDWQPCWSPSGTEIAFSSFRYCDWDIFKVNADGQHIIRLTKSKGTEQYPSWGRGGIIYFSFYTKSQGWEIAMLQLNK